MSKFIGLVSAYAYAKSKGYTGTEEEFAILMAEYASVTETAVEAVRIATESAQSAAAASSDVNRTAATVTQQAAQVHDDAETSSESAATASEAKETAVDMALDSEAWAVGKRGGEDVGSSDPAYHNNAKYYAESASASAQTATEAAQTATVKASEAQASASAAAESARTLTIDATLTKKGQAADAKMVRDTIEHITGCSTVEYTTGGYIALNSATANINTVVSNPAWKHAIISCVKGDYFTIYGVGGSAPRAWGFIAADGTILSVANASTTENGTIIVAPANTSYLVLNDNSGGISLKGRTTDEAISLLESALDDAVYEYTSEFNSLRITNVILRKSEIVISGNSSFTYEDIYETPVSEGDVYTLEYGTLTGETAVSTVGYIYAYNGETLVTSVNLRKTSKKITYVVPSNVNKLKFTLVPSQNSTQVTATYTDVLICKGTTAEVTIKRECLPEITPTDTNFFHISSNLVNPEETVSGEFVNQTNGNFGDGASYTRTTYIPVKSGESYLIKSSRGSAVAIRYAFYDINKAYISGAMPTAAAYYILTAPNNAAFIAISADSFYFPMMIADEATDAPFEDYDNAYIMPQYVVDNVGGALLNIPNKIYAVSGFELNIYFENITENWEDYSWNVTCTKGMQSERGFRITPTDADAGTYDLTIEIASKKNPAVAKSITTSLVVTASTAGASTSETIIVLGDSTTNSGYAIEKLHTNFANDSMQVTTLGTRGTAPNNHEGRSGWRFSSYFNPPNAGDIAAGVENPWYNPTSETFDANYYFTTTGVAKPDWLFINLGINDMFSMLNDSVLDGQIDTCLSLCDDMIASIKSASPSTKIAVCYTIPPNHSQDAFGKAYQCGQTRGRYKHNNAKWVNAMIAKYDGQESNGIYTIPIHTNLDTVYNMGLESMPVNSRNSTTYMSPIANGGVHPAIEGYWQIADVYTAFLKAHAED